MGHDVVVVGSINVDLLLTVPRHPLPGETLLGGSGAQSAGGKGANQAVAAARLGARTALLGAVGTDPGAQTALRLLREAGVDLHAVATAPGPTGLAVVTLAADGENTIVVVPGANDTVTVDAVRASADLIGQAAVCVLQAEIPLTAVSEAAAIAHRGGARVVLNVAPAATLPWETLRLADPLVVNEHEAAVLLGDTTTDPGTDPVQVTAAAAQAAERLRAGGVASVIVTLGGAGCIVLDDTGPTIIPARDVSAVDTTGAGDAFTGAVAARLAMGEPLRQAAEYATRVAAASVRTLGTQTSYPWKDDPLP